MRRVALLVLAACGTSIAGAQSRDARVDSIFAFATSSTPGCAVSAIRNGAIVYAHGYGMADLEHDARITPETPFYMASVSKQFTAGAIDLLVLDGKLSLDDRARKWVPELPAYAATITIRELMHHTSGLRDYLTLFGLRGLTDYPITNGEFLETLGKQSALNFPPGEQFSYSNSGYTLLSIIVQRASGKSLRDFAAERIFAPLGMASSQFRDRHNILIPKRALAYARPAPGRYVLNVPYFDVVGDGGLYSTASDIAKWEENFQTPRIAGGDWLRLESERATLNDGTPIPYGAGLFYSSYRGDSIIDHGGSLGGYNIDLLRFPKRHFSVAVLCNDNAVPSARLAQRVADVFLGDSLAPMVASAAPLAPAVPYGDVASLRKYDGLFFNDRAMTLRTISVRDGKLYYVRGPGDESVLIPMGNARYRMADNPVIVDLSKADVIRAESVGPPSMFRRVGPAGKTGQREYAGTFTSADLGVTWTISVADSVVTLRESRGEPIKLEPAFADAFRGGGLTVRFTRNAKRTVTGMDVSAGERVRNVRFVKAPLSGSLGT